jgi:hypothetical protein
MDPENFPDPWGFMYWCGYIKVSVAVIKYLP